MTAIRVLLAGLLLSALAACDSNEGSGSGTRSAFRNLGKRADSNLGSERAGVPLR